MNFYELKVSVGSEEEGMALLKKLIAERVLSGGNVLRSRAMFYWKERVNETEDFILSSVVFTNKPEAVELKISKLAEYEDPIITFVKIDYINKKAADHIQLNTTNE